MTTSCRACGHPRVVDVSPIADHASSPVVMKIGGATPTARFCRSCGAVEWRLPTDARAGEPGPACEGCGGTRRVEFASVDDHVGRDRVRPLGEEDNPLAASKCARCGLVAWRFARVPDGEAHDEPCRHCQSNATVTSRLRDQIGWWREATFGVDAEHPFELVSCRDCLRVSFRIAEPRTVRADGKRIVAVEPQLAERGPYRGEPMKWLPVEVAVEPERLIDTVPPDRRRPPCEVHQVVLARQVLDLAAERAAPLSVTEQEGVLRVLFCRVCRRAAWRIDAEDLFWRSGGREHARCRTCRGKTVLFERVPQAVGERYLRALDVRTFPLQAAACTHCFAVHWEVTSLWIDDAPGAETCSGCGRHTSVSCRVWDWVTPDEARPLGVAPHTALRAYVCNHCAYVDWSLDGADQVVADGVRLVDLGTKGSL